MTVFDNRTVAIVTPHVQFPLREEEQISLRHLRAHLGAYDRYIIGPSELPGELHDFRLQKFPAKYFASISGYSRLLVSPEFYQAFKQYKYILIYQLDCLVFSPDLSQWCNREWDYAGAPWMAAYPWIPGRGYDPNDAEGFWWVGNGGLSLRHVDNALRVLNSKQYCVEPAVLSARTRFSVTSPLMRKSILFLKNILHTAGYKNNVRYFIDNMAGSGGFHEDLFWAFHAKHFLPEFCIPPPEEAVHFSFECAPRYCFKATGGRLPFGCHAWWKYDREFWEPYLLKK